MISRWNAFAAIGLSMALASAAAAREFDYRSLLRHPTPDAVGQIIENAKTNGGGEHHLLLTYCTAAPGVLLPPDVRRRNPTEITIVLQWQYWDLERDGDVVRVTVSFDGQPARIAIPLKALTGFSDEYAGVSVDLRNGETSEERCKSADSI